MRMARGVVVVLAFFMSARAAGAAGAAVASGPAGEPEMHPMHAGPGFAPAEVEMRSADGRVTVPFTLVNNNVILQATIQGKRLDLILDTGMPMDGLMLYKKLKVQSMDLSYTEGMKAHIAGAGADGSYIEADIATNLSVDIGDLRLKNLTAMVSPPLPGLSDYHDGVIGATLFNHFVVALDYDAKQITLSRPEGWAPPKGAVSIPFTLQHNTPYIDIAVLGADGRRMPATVVVDLGAGHPISLNLGSVEGLAVPAGAIRATFGRGASGRLRGQVGRVAGLEIGGAVLRDVVAMFPDADSQSPGGRPSRGGNLGDGVLQRFNVAFDYAQKRLVLSPNKAFGQPFEWDMSGMSLLPDDRGALRVESVVENSPAAGAGLAAGDIVTRVNGRDVSADDLLGLRERMRKPGETFDLAVRRDGKTVAITFKTARLV